MGTTEMPRHHGLNLFRVKIRAGKGLGVQEHLPNVIGQGIAEPYTVVGELMAAEKHSIEVEGREKVVNAGHPLGHSIVVSVLCPEGKLLESVVGHGQRTIGIDPDAPIGS